MFSKIGNCQKTAKKRLRRIFDLFFWMKNCCAGWMIKAAIFFSPLHAFLFIQLILNSNFI